MFCSSIYDFLFALGFFLFLVCFFWGGGEGLICVFGAGGGGEGGGKGVRAMGDEGPLFSFKSYFSNDKHVVSLLVVT